MKPVETLSLVDLSQRLANELCQLSASLFMTYGEQGDVFRISDDEIQDSFLWGVHEKSVHLKEMAELLASRLFCSGEVHHE